MNALVLSAGLSLALLSGDQAVHGVTGQERIKPDAHATAMEDAAVARRAIAQRYLNCGLTKVLDFQEAGRQHNVPADKPRDKVKITVGVTESASAIAAMQKYDKDGDVTWMPQDLMARERVPGKRGEDALGTPIPGELVIGKGDGNATSISRYVYPYASRTKGNVGVFVTQSAETSDYKSGHVYGSFVAKYCGTMVLKTESDGERRWQIDPYAEPMDDIYKEQTCDLIEDKSQPGLYNVDC